VQSKTDNGGVLHHKKPVAQRGFQLVNQ
jgi:hypothetical protein